MDNTQQQQQLQIGNPNAAYNNGPRLPPQSQPMDREQAAAIAEVSVMPDNNGPPTTTTTTATNPGGRRATNELDDAVLQGDVQTLDEAGVQVRSLFLEFLYQL